MDKFDWEALLVLGLPLALGILYLAARGRAWLRARDYRNKYRPPKGFVMIRSKSYVSLINDRERLRQLRAKIERES